MIRLLIVDDEPDVIDNLRAYFRRVAHIDVVADASDGEAALRAIAEYSPDVVLSDIHMPGTDGLGLLKEVQSMPHPPAFIAMTGVDTDGSMLETLAGGGAGYILKSQPIGSIIRAVGDALQGGTSISPTALSRLVNYLPLSAASEEMPTVSGTEKRVLSLLCRGLSNSEIAEELHYSESSIKRHVSHLMEIFDCSSRLKLVLRVLGSS